MPTRPDAGSYFAVTLSNSAGRTGTGAPESPWKWSRAFASAAEAKAECKAVMDRGAASLAFLVRARDGKKSVLGIYPNQAKGVIYHWLDLLALIGRETPDPRTEDRG
jgi:hypothetical protein